MTIDGSDDNKIRIQGYKEVYSFTDADGGPKGIDSDIDEEEEEEDAEELADVESEGEEAAAADDDEEAEGGMDSSDEEDDTALDLWACGDAPETPPKGFKYASCPRLETDADHAALVGRHILVAHHQDPIGWHVGRVRFFGVGNRWKKVCPTANFVVRYSKKETNGAMSDGVMEGLELSQINYGRHEWWLLLDRTDSTTNDSEDEAALGGPSTPMEMPSISLSELSEIQS
jgi:hypothetical protein